MQRTLITLLMSASAFSPALADDTPSAAEIHYIRDELAAYGCHGGEIERENKGRYGYIYEVDDADCQGEEYEIKLNSRFRVISMKRD